MEERESSSQKLWQFFQSNQDKLQIYKGRRWAFLVTVICLYALRVGIIGGYYVVSYCMAVFILNQFLLFLTPIQADIDDEIVDNPVLPVNSPGEFKPFIRKIHEFNLWRNCTVAVIIGVSCTFFTVFNVPVFWPVLVFYFVILFVVTMRRQIAHMVKHGYVPFDIGKEDYTKS